MMLLAVYFAFAVGISFLDHRGPTPAHFLLRPGPSCNNPLAHHQPASGFLR